MKNYKNIILTMLIVTGLQSSSLEDHLLKSNDFKIKEKTIKKEYYKNEYQTHYDLIKSKLIIKNETDSKNILRIKNNTTNKTTTDILILPFAKEEIELPLGSYNITMYYSSQDKKFINFEKLFGKTTKEYNNKSLVEFNKSFTYKHLCNGKFTLNINADIGDIKENSMLKTTTYYEYGECIQNQEFILKKKKIKNKEIEKKKIKTKKQTDFI